MKENSTIAINWNREKEQSTDTKQINYLIMEKFSFYDLLSVLFPGVVFVFMLNAVLGLFGFADCFDLGEEWELTVIFSVLFGALIYVTGFLLTSHCKWMYRLSGLYMPVSQLFFRLQLPEAVTETLNRRADQWYGKAIFTTSAVYKALPEQEQAELEKMQDEFYDRMYYELDYAGKLDTAKAFQSFYFFFRAVFIASLLSALIGIVLYLLHFLAFLQIPAPEETKLCCTGVALLLLLFVSVIIARWYRQRMVYKMYWYFYTHINSKN